MDKVILELAKKYPHLKRLQDDHQKCERKLSKFNALKKLRPQDEVEKKKLQKLKLQKKDEIERIVFEIKQRKKIA